ncbi:ABC transporter ATP-binding protein [bacterium]|nr:ABC transporter ATP-binding protein [bacterium]
MAKNTVRKYSLYSNAAFILSYIRKEQKSVFLLYLWSIPASLILRLSDSFFAKYAVLSVSLGSLGYLTVSVLIFATVKLMIEGVDVIASNSLKTKNYRLRASYIKKFSERYMKLPYEEIESEKGQQRAQRAKNQLFARDFNSQLCIESFPQQIVAVISGLFGITVYAGIISFLNPLVILALVVICATTIGLQKYLSRFDHENKNEYVPVERKMDYVGTEAKNFSSVKDIRMYGISGWLKKIFEEQFGLWVKIWRKRSVLNSVITVILGTLNAVFRLGVYVFLFFEFYQNKIDVSNFVLYFGVITGFNSWLQSFVSNIEGLNRISYDIDDLHRFMEEGAAEGSTDSVPEETDNAIEVDNLHFAYTKDEEGNEEKTTEVIRGMNFRIKKGEKIGIVGPNGSGKTTLVKLICGLYRPSSGTVKVCGYDTSTTKKETIYDLISPVFQDVYMLPTTIGRNITMTPFADTEKLSKCIEDSGLGDKIKRLPDGAETIIVKSVREEAIQLSGGETQKLALARALYKGGKVLILDEPTAALDPLAESEMYQKYGKLTEGVASIFISHRLASTRFCDRIFLIENGVIAEEGTHDELMALGGKYADMFEVQSKYYRDSPGAAEL